MPKTHKIQTSEIKYAIIPDYDLSQTGGLKYDYDNLLYTPDEIKFPRKLKKRVQKMLWKITHPVRCTIKCTGRDFRGERGAYRQFKDFAESLQGLKAIDKSLYNELNFLSIDLETL